MLDKNTTKLNRKRKKLNVAYLLEGLGISYKLITKVNFPSDVYFNADKFL